MSATTSKNLAARMGRWSAAHWKTATFGWLAFVLVAFALGGMVGHEERRPEHGRARRVGPHGQDPRRGLQAARRRERPDPEPLASRRRSRLHGGDRGRRRARLEGRRRFRTSAPRRRSPRTGARRSSSSRSAATRTRLPTRSTRSSTGVAAAQQAHPGFFIGEFGDASAAEGESRPPTANDLGKAGLLSLPITLIILVLAFGALVAAGIPLLLALTRRVRDVRADRAAQPPACRSRSRRTRSCS